MRKERNKKASAANPRVLLDGEPVSIPEHAAGRLASLRAHLELVALRRDRILTALWVDGVAIDLDRGVVPGCGFARVEAHTLSFAELGAAMLATVHREVVAIHARVEQAAAQVLINSWTAARDLTQDLEAELRTIFLLLGFIDELRGGSSGTETPDADALRIHLEGVDFLRAKLRVAARGRSVEDLSDYLVLAMAPWVGHLEHLLSRNHE